MTIPYSTLVPSSDEQWAADRRGHEETGSQQAVIGPNAVIQLAAELRAQLGEAEARRLFEHAGLADWLDHPPQEMVVQEKAAALYRSLFLLHSNERARSIAYEAGRRVADYVMAHRIPKPAQWLLKALPGFLATPLLMAAIKKNAWTFAGSGRVSLQQGSNRRIAIDGNPLRMPGCAWHMGVFDRLFQTLASPRISVRHGHLDAEGRTLCFFQLSMEPA